MRKLFGTVERRQPVEALVRHLGHSNMSLARVSVRLVGEMRLGENAKQRSLAYLGQANDASFHIREKETGMMITVGFTPTTARSDKPPPGRAESLHFRFTWTSDVKRRIAREREGQRAQHQSRQLKPGSHPCAE